MISRSGLKKNWLLPAAASLLLHAAVAILLPAAPREKAITEPELKLSLRSAPPVQTSPPRTMETREAKPRTEPAAQPRQQAKPRPEPKPAQSPKNAALSKPDAAAQNMARGDAPHTENDTNRGDTAQAQPESPAGATGGRMPRTGPVELGSLKIIKEVIPDYPAFSRKRGEEGEARIIVTIKNGAVAVAEVYKSSGSKRLDQSALRAAKQWRFAGADDVQAVIPFVFSLTD